MKPLPQSNRFYQYFDGVRLYRDDLEHILAIMRDAKLDTTITDERFEYESLDEFQKKRGNSPGEIKIEGESHSSYYSSVFLSLSKRKWNLGSFSSNSVGIFHEIERILRERQTPIASVPFHWVVVAGMIAGGIGSVLPAPTSRPFLWTGFILLCMSAVVGFYPFFRAAVVLDYKHEAGFISCNRDKIIVAVCTAIFLTALQLLIGFLTGKDIKLFGP